MLKRLLQPFIQKAKPSSRTLPSLSADMASVFRDKAMVTSENCRKLFFKCQSELEAELVDSIDAAIAEVTLLMSDLKFENPTPESSYQVGLSASFIRTHQVIIELLPSGHTLESIVLLRKQMETLARFRELDHKSASQLKGRTPNIKYLNMTDAGKAYGHYSKLAHFSDPTVTEVLGFDITGEGIAAPHTFPEYSADLLGFMNTNCLLGIQFVSGMVNKIPQWDSKIEISHLVIMGEHAVNRARSLGIIQVNPVGV